MTNVKCVKIVKFISKEKQNRKCENALQSNCTNNGATNGLKQKKGKKHVKQFYMVK